MVKDRKEVRVAGCDNKEESGWGDGWRDKSGRLRKVLRAVLRSFVFYCKNNKKPCSLWS